MNEEELLNKLTRSLPDEQFDSVIALEEIRSQRVLKGLANALVSKQVAVEVKVEILRSIMARPKASKSKRHFASAISEVLLSQKEDLVVRQFAAKAARGMVGEATVLSGLRSVAEDRKEDLDLRYNSVCSMKALLDPPRFLDFIVSLQADPEIRPYLQTINST